MKLILSAKRIELTIERLCMELIEQHGNFENTCLIGLQKGGKPLADRIHKRLLELLPVDKIEYGNIDVTFYRDDARRTKANIETSRTIMDFIVEDKKVILIDDVVFTGRTIAAGLAALQPFGRPSSVKLLTLVNRRFKRQLPIEADYVGITIDTIGGDYVVVEWEEIEGQNRVIVNS